MPPPHPPSESPPPPPPPLPRVAAALLRRLLPYAEQREVLADLAADAAHIRAQLGDRAAWRWTWGQVLTSLPALVRHGWWRGWSGFDPQANRTRPGGPMLESWIKDLRYAARRLVSRPTYACLAVLTLALGAGGTAAMASIARGILLDPLPYADEHELGMFWNPFDWSEREFLTVGPDFPGFREVAAYRPQDMTLAQDNLPLRLTPGIASSAELFEVLGTPPMLGRGFAEGDDREGAAPVAVLSHGLWRDLGADPSIVGQSLTFDGASRLVVGVMPPGFYFPDPSVRVWTPAPLSMERGSGNYALVGRVEQGGSINNLAVPLQRITTALGESFEYSPQWDKTRNAAVTPIRETMVGDLRPALLATLAAMSVILLIACSNVAALMLAQVDSRSTELAVRSALGAGRGRITRQLLIESLLVGAIAGAVGAALAAGGFRVLVTTLPLGALAETASLDWTIFWGAIGIALLAALIIAIVPAVAVWRGDLRGSLSRSRTSGIAGGGGRLEHALVIGQVALAVLLAAGAGLLIRSVGNLRAIDPGVMTTDVAILDVVAANGLDATQRRQALDEIMQRVQAIPGVAGVGATGKLPLRGRGNSFGIGVERSPELERSTTYFRVVSPGYFEALGMTLRSGRFITDEDRAGSEPVTVINESLARQYFPDVDPIGQRISTFDGWERIVGVIADAAEADLIDEPAPARYMAYAQVPQEGWIIGQGQTLVLRLQPGTDPAPVLDAAAQVVRRDVADVAVEQATTMESVFLKAVGPARQIMTLLTLLTLLALTLGAIGIYGVISHLVTRRQRDWGIRIALGLQPSTVVRTVVARGGALVAIGSVFGVIGMLLLARLLASLLYGIGTADPLALAGAVGTLFVVGLIAAFIPAYRASRTDPAGVLREQ